MATEDPQPFTSAGGGASVNRQPESDSVETRAAFCTTLIREAGEIAGEGFALQSERQIMTKGPQDFLTETDLAVEKFIRSRIEAHFPDDGFFGEETGSVAGDVIWVVDPIDGTANFARGIPHYCIAIACLQDNEVQFGAIYNPCTDELYFARAGSGAFLNGDAIKVALTKSAQEATVEIGWSNRRPNQEYLDVLGSALNAGANARRTSSGALALAYVADGRSDGYAELHMNSWDCLAGMLLVHEAGGVIGGTAWSGDLTSGGSVLAAIPAIVDLLVDATGIPVHQTS